MTLQPKAIDRTAEPPSGDDEELNHMLHRADMAKPQTTAAMLSWG